jgi:serine/threonine-protein kinase
MGVVYQGFDPVIGRTVAIKTMLTEGLGPAEFEDFKARFQREAQAAGVLNHPNIVTIFDFGEDSGILYLAMEFLEGRSLQDIVEAEGVLPVERIVPIYEQVCSALDHAHSNRIIHRDIKPANIMILQTGLVKVTDFGIAKMMATGMTQAGQILGTPNYMSPEQVRGRHIDGRSDIFSLGIILYELVTGEKPFGGQNVTTVIYRIINENPIPPRELDSTIHPGLSYVIQKTLAKSPEERYQTCRELAEDLRNYRRLGSAVAPSETVIVRVPPVGSTLAETRQVAPLRPVPPAAPLTPGEQPITRPLSVQVIPPVQLQPKQTSPATWILLALLLLAGAGGGYYWLMRKQAPPQVVQTTPGPQGAPAGQTPADVTPPPPQVDVSGTQPDGQPAGVNIAPSTTSATDAGAPAGQLTSPTSPPITGQGTSPVESRPSMPASAGGARVDKTPGSLVVTANVADAQIAVDGKRSPGWVTPFIVADLPPGMHSVVVSKDGYNSAQRIVTIEPGRAANLNVELTMPTGEINIETVPAGIETAIDGQPVGKTPIQKPVGLGRHTFTLKAPGMEPYTSSFEIKYDGYIVTKRINLGGAAVAPTGVVEVRTTPPGATVLVNGTPAGGATPTSFRVNAGRVTLTISLAGHQTVQKDVDVPADGTVTVHEKLHQ